MYSTDWSQDMSTELERILFHKKTSFQYYKGNNMWIVLGGGKGVKYVFHAKYVCIHY